MDSNANIYVAGHRGMVGSALVRSLEASGYDHLVTRTHAELDLTDQQAVRRFFATQEIDTVFLAAAKVGGIHANDVYRADFLFQNQMIQTNVIQAAFKAGIRRLLFLGSSCIYPRHCPQPMREESLLSGYLEPTNEPYAIAKIAGIKLCESFNRQYGTRYRSVMPTNLYGPNDNYDLMNSHVLPAMMRKFHLAKLAAEGRTDAIREDEAVYGPIPEDIRQTLGQNPPVVRLWGTGVAQREFLHVDDMAAACRLVMQASDQAYHDVCRADPAYRESGLKAVSFLNVGSGKEISIRALADIISRVVEFQGAISWDPSKPDGMPRKLMDGARLGRLGWRPRIELEQGIRETYAAYREKRHLKKNQAP
jgi:GDP-L-fucose synthase